MVDKEEWNDVEVLEKEKEKIDFEVESEAKVETKTKDEVKPKLEPEQQAPELEGIETKGAEKRIKQLIRQRKERDEQIAQLIQQNESLQSSAKNKQNQFNKISKLNLDATEKQLKDKLDLARGAYTDAFESQDKNKLLKAQEALNEAQTDLKNVAVTKQNFQEEPKQEIQQPQPKQTYQPVRPDTKAVDWQSNNEWFGKDNVMTASALAIDAELKSEGYNPTDQDFYTEIDKRIRSSFPHKFTEKTEQIERTDGSSSPSQVVAGGSRSSPNPKKVKLSQEDVRLANKWGIPLEKYASEKMKVTKSEGDYTTINMQRGGK